MSAAEIVRAVEAQPLDFTDRQMQILRDSFCRGATQEEFNVLLETARIRRLDPFKREIYFVKRYDGQLRREVWSTQVGIDGFRVKADRTGLYAGQDEPVFEYDDKGRLKVAKVAVYRKDWPGRPCVGFAYWSEYVQTTREGEPTKFWRQMPHVMLAKCAEAAALRKAFPQDLAGIYIPEEMMQATTVDAEVEEPEAPPTRVLSAPKSAPKQLPAAKTKSPLAEDVAGDDLPTSWQGETRADARGPVGQALALTPSNQHTTTSASTFLREPTPRPPEARSSPRAAAPAR